MFTAIMWYLERRQEERAVLNRYRVHLAQYQHWLCEMPDVCDVLRNLSAEAEGNEPLSAGFPHPAKGPCEISSLRDRLRKTRRSLKLQVAEQYASGPINQRVTDVGMLEMIRAVNSVCLLLESDRTEPRCDAARHLRDTFCTALDTHVANSKSAELAAKVKAAMELSA
jgi:hypothetical protein